MFKNYVKLAVRNILRKKGYTILNLTGLAAGMACFTLIYLYVQDELSYDSFHKNAENMYRLVNDRTVIGRVRSFAWAPGPSSPTAAAELPEVLDYTRIIDLRVTTDPPRQVTSEGQTFEEPAILFGDSTFFSFFTYDFIEGEARTSLNNPNSAVITKSIAEKLFGTDKAVGKHITINTLPEVTITGVIKNVPKNSHFGFDYMISTTSLNEGLQNIFLNSWTIAHAYSYIKTKDGVNEKELGAKVSQIVKRNLIDGTNTANIDMDVSLQKVTDIHLNSHREFELQANGEKMYIYIFSAVAAFVLLIACINFMNLSTARSANRVKEVGLRKVFGAYKKQLVGQFLIESVLTAALGFILALVIVKLTMPAFNQLSGKDMSFDFLVNSNIIPGIGLMVLITGLISGSYPALFLSAFRPAAVLKGILSTGVRGAGLRRGLVVFQFSISLILIISTIIVLNQLQFMQNKYLGFDKEQILVVTIQDAQNTGAKWRAISEELKQIPNVLEVSVSSSIPGRRRHPALSVIPEGGSQEEGLFMEIIWIDYNFVKTYGITMAAGRDLSESFSTDANQAFLINETAAEKFGFGKNAVGKTIDMGAGTGHDRKGKIVGVVKDFHITSLKQKIGPIALTFEPDDARDLSIRLNTVDVSRTIDAIQNTWSKIEPNETFEYFFLDDDFDKNYQAEEKLGTIFSFFSGLAILIACLGLFGLASFTAEQNASEIGIRKVLGASNSGLIFKLTNNFVKWVLTANLIAWPVSYFVMHYYWLANFAYRQSISITIFIGVCLMSIVLSILTVGYQSIKAALSDPVKVLRYE